jgi:hypothetical protein
MPTVSKIPRTMYGRFAIFVDSSWWLLVSPVGQLGIPGEIAGARCYRINHDNPVNVTSDMLANNSIMIDGRTHYEAIRPILRPQPKDSGGEVDPLTAHLVDDNSLGAYVGEPRLLARAPKPLRGKRR